MPKTRPLLLLILMVLAVLILVNGVRAPETQAHPHCFILNSVRFIFNTDGLEKVRLDWQFDDFFSQQILLDCDRNGDRLLDDEEKGCIRENYFAALKDYEFFTFITVNGQSLKNPAPGELGISLIENKLLYQFTLPCEVPATGSPQEVRVSLYDPTFYCAMSFPEQLPVMVEAGSGIDFEVSVGENLQKTYYYGQFHPWEAALFFCRLPCGGESAVADTGAAPQPTEDRTLSAKPGEDIPFSSPQADADETPKPPKEAARSETSFGLLAWLLEQQNRLYQRMAELTREIDGGRASGALALLLGIAFLYGLVHAAGPGHGKVFAASFVLAHGPDLKRAMLLGNMIALFHGLSAAVLVIVLNTTLVALTGQSVGQVEHVAKIISYSLISVIGLFLFMGAWIEMRKKRGGESLFKRGANPWVMAATIGLVPCPGVVLVLLFALSLGVLWVGLLMAVVQTAGMALTISLVTLLTTTGRSGGLRLLGRNERVLKAVEGALGLLAGICVFLLGLIFLIGAIQA